MTPSFFRWAGRRFGPAGALLLGAAFLTPAGALAQGAPPAAPAPTAAPTATTSTPEQMDATWRQASSRAAREREALLKKVAASDAAGPFRPDWISLRTWQMPDWYADAKFGIFIHWGVYSVPAFGSEWYSRRMYIQGSKEYQHHLAVYGTPDKFGYKDFIPQFKAEKFDPRAWASLFRASGARYVVPVAEHHDGFAMYATRLSDWSALRMGPKRDLIGDLVRAVRAQGLHLGLSSHRAEHDWFFGEGRKIASDVNDPRYADLYGPAEARLTAEDTGDAQMMGDFTHVSPAWLDDWLARTAELVEDYHPDLIYFDWWISHPAFRTTLPKFLAYYYNTQSRRGGSAVVNYKEGALADGSGVADVERGLMPDIQPRVWQTCTSLGDYSWGYIEGERYKSPKKIIHLLADIVSKNGNLLLNIGPRADGTIPQEAQDSLLAIGAWLKTNGEAIYGTRPWRQFGEGPARMASGSFKEGETDKPFGPEDFRFTTKDGTLYAIEMGWPEEGKAIIHALPAGEPVKAVTLLDGGAGQALVFHQDEDGLHLVVSKRAPGDHAFVYRIER
ncbi:alpha-L-fucosidase [Nitrospirillum sp. BR 11163]|uniref:alpha-L-fucosidase n=1 Tax=Nitrospirillum sp. BR 11163 TaxID=3104323 RepID=UPI002AFECA27|nr:alpha-L-fucosidase [Nitrospirillum sp. BR 11163]MEA1675850.1 alpha-L-fucosidase [Nitrospirillum sp. BR 11163]